MYDYLVVGSGLFGAICAYELSRAGKRVYVIEKRKHIGGNIYTEKVEDINVHRYGAHIFHTSDRAVWSMSTALPSSTVLSISPSHGTRMNATIFPST